MRDECPWNSTCRRHCGGLTVRVAIHPDHEQEPYQMPHQAMWFVVLLIGLLLLLGKSVAAVL